jgi:hypothetical protein
MLAAETRRLQTRGGRAKEEDECRQPKFADICGKKQATTSPLLLQTAITIVASTTYRFLEPSRRPPERRREATRARGPCGLLFFCGDHFNACRHLVDTHFFTAIVHDCSATAAHTSSSSHNFNIQMHTTITRAWCPVCDRSFLLSSSFSYPLALCT